MDPRHSGRSPSPGHPLEGYLDDRAYPPGAPLEIPMGPAGTSVDRLQTQPTVSRPANLQDVLI